MHDSAKYVYFIDLQDLEVFETLEGSSKGKVSLRDVFFISLQALNDRKEIQLDEKGRNELSEGRYLETFEIRRRNLDEIETKYSKFMDPNLVNSVMEIQNNLQGITIDIHELLRSRKNREYEKYTLDKITTKMHIIIKETYKIYEMGLKFTFDITFFLVVY